MRALLGRWVGLASVVLIAAVAATTAEAQWTIESPDHGSSIKLGFLIQGRAESFELANGTDEANDLYFRRMRLLAGGQISKSLTFFFDTDSPNLGKGAADGSKNRPDIYIQDLVLTYSCGDAFKLDGGLILIPTCYTCNQSAASLLPVDYGDFSFLSSGPTTANVGRDYGLQARGYVAGKHVEYRLGVFQGARVEGSTVGFRYSGRLTWHVFEAQTGLFYTGTSLGTKRLLALGASFDRQEEYSTYALDLFFDYPVFDGDGVTLQADWVKWDGDTFFPQLPEQETWLLEASYHIGAWKLSPFAQYLRRQYGASQAPEETHWQVGLAWFGRGHNLTVKLGVGQHEVDGAADRLRAILQAQVFMF
jgi:hypothetical protein